jgi:pyruvate/oxaloacetate carboxyltransferase
MARKLKIRDLTLRDGQQSLFATRMPQAEIDKVLDLYTKAGFYAMEVWGGAVPDSIMRFLDEDPWTRLDIYKKKLGGISKLTALSRGRNLFGYNPYPEDVVEGFNRHAVRSGIDIMRIFDCLNDVNNMKSTIKFVQENGGIADCAVCYTVDSKLPTKEEDLKKIDIKNLPEQIFTVDYFLDLARKMEAMGADMISLKDMAGLVPPSLAGKIIGQMKRELKVPIDFHTHCTPGYGLGAVLMAIIHGVDIIDSNIMSFAGGPAAPAWELVYIFCKKLGIEVEGDPDIIYQINKILLKSRMEALEKVDEYKMYPIEFHVEKDKLPAEIDKLFDDAIRFAKEDKEAELLKAIHAIEKYFNFPEPDILVKNAEIPGGMYTNMLSQLKTLKLEHLLERVLEVVPIVRLAAGSPPLVTPSSQIVGAEAVNCVIDENAGNPFYTNNSVQFVKLVKGEYGKTPIPIDPAFREKICGIKEETPYDTSKHKKQENPTFPIFGGVKLAQNEREELLLELFPNVAKDFLKKRIERTYVENIKTRREERMKKAGKKGKLLFRDLTLRDGQQSLFATRMPQGEIEKVLGYYKLANFYAMEVWGGAVPDSIMRFLNEDPWYRLESIKKEIGEVSKLTALSRGRNLFGYNPYPEEVIEGFCRNAVQSGIGIMRIFDCLNDVDNMRTTIKYVKENGGIADCAVCFTVDSKFSTKQKLFAMLSGQKIPGKIFTTEYFVDLAKQMEALGADMISLKDMAGLVSPSAAGEIIREIKKAVKLPIDFHTHCTPGYGLAACMMAIVNGVDILDTNLMNFAGGPAAPSFEIIQLFCDRYGIETDINLDAVVKINKELKGIRERMAEFDSYKQFPIDFDITRQELPDEIDKLFYQAIDAAKADREEDLLNICHAIEKYFNFPEPDELVKNAEIPGGMYTNMLSQLKQLKLDHLLEKVLQQVPVVRIKAGCPPLVTPSSQIVGAQAVNCVIDENNGKPAYTNVSNQFRSLVKGEYGHTPFPIDPAFREQICGHREPRDYDTAAYKRQANPVLEEYGGTKLAINEKEELLLELFPTVATKYLHEKREIEYLTKVYEEEEAKRKSYEEKRSEYLRMSAKEKHDRLQQGLNFWYA